jgi:hypothetical protein
MKTLLIYVNYYVVVGLDTIANIHYCTQSEGHHSTIHDTSDLSSSFESL